MTAAPPRGFFLNPWVQLALSVLCVAASEVFLKRGALEAPHLSPSLNWTGVSGLASLHVWIGIVFVIASFISWLYVLRYIPLTIAFPLSSSVHVLVPLASHYFLNEMVTLQRWCGIALVMIGILIVAKQVAQLEEKL
ncbi:MAG: EamA family transporter [Verrucomicrobiota bacterium]|nr:EamA family transporter [Verrucomicrobiota bacterium]